jgi:hypothetical protein
MSEPKDPEQLLADALRAQAVFAPSASPPAPAREPEPGTDAVPTSAINELPSAYGLLSGASADSLEHPKRQRRTSHVPRNRQGKGRSCPRTGSCCSRCCSASPRGPWWACSHSSDRVSVTTQGDPVPFLG